MTALNIKNEEAYRLVRELAELRGESMTQVIIEIAREAIEREQGRAIREDRTAYWLAKGKEIRSRASDEWLNLDHGDMLYDEHGLPK